MSREAMKVGAVKPKAPRRGGAKAAAPASAIKAGAGERAASVAGLLIPLALFLASAASMALEIVAGRLLAPYVGMSLYSWTAIIAVVLGGLAIGHWLGGQRADRSERPRREVAMILGGGALSVAAVPLLLRAISPAAMAMEPLSAIGLLSLGLFFAPSCLAGALSPLLTKAALDRAEPARHGRVLGRMYALGAGGAIAGTLAAGFVMISEFGSTASVLIIAGVYAALAAGFALQERRRAPRAALLLALTPFLGAAALRGLAPDAWATPCLVESAYFCIRVDEATALTGRPSRLLALDHLVHGVNDRDDPLRLHSPYLQLTDELARRRFRGRDDISAFFVGGGAYTLPRAWAARWPNSRLVVAELDPMVTEAATGLMWLDDSPPISILHQDARAALARLPESETFDVIFGDAFHDIAIPQHLVTDEFHALVKSRLKPGGVYVINVIEALRRPPFLLSLTKTLQARFRYVGLWLSADDLSPTERRVTWVVTASDQDDPFDRLGSAEYGKRIWLRAPTNEMMGLIPDDELVFLTDDYTPVDRLMRHVLLDRRLSQE